MAATGKRSHADMQGSGSSSGSSWWRSVAPQEGGGWPPETEGPHARQPVPAPNAQPEFIGPSSPPPPAEFTGPPAHPPVPAPTQAPSASEGQPAHAPMLMHGPLPGMFADPSAPMPMLSALPGAFVGPPVRPPFPTPGPLPGVFVGPPVHPAIPMPGPPHGAFPVCTPFGGPSMAYGGPAPRMMPFPRPGIQAFPVPRPMHPFQGPPGQFPRGPDMRFDEPDSRKRPREPRPDHQYQQPPGRIIAPRPKPPKIPTDPKPIIVVNRGATSVMYDHVQATTKLRPVFVDLTPAERPADPVTGRVKPGPKIFVFIAKVGDDTYGPAEGGSKREARFKAARMYLTQKAPELNLTLLADFRTAALDPSEGYRRGEVVNPDTPNTESATIMDPPVRRRKVAATAPGGENNNLVPTVNVSQLVARLTSCDHRVIGTCHYKTIEVEADPDAEKEDPHNKTHKVHCVANLNNASTTATLKLQEANGGYKKPPPPPAGTYPPGIRPPRFSLENHHALAEGMAKEDYACEKAAIAAGEEVLKDAQGKTCAQVICEGGGFLIAEGTGATKKIAKDNSSIAMLKLLLPELPDPYAVEAHLNALEKAKKDRLENVKVLRAEAKKRKLERNAARAAARAGHPLPAAAAPPAINMAANAGNGGH